MTPLPLTRAANLADFRDCYSVGRWQQAHGLTSYQRWRDGRPPACACEGDTVIFNWGASPFVGPRTPGPTHYYDRLDTPVVLVDGSCQTIYAYSVLDRIDGPQRFLRATYAALAPGGLLVATFALWDADGPDVAIGHQLRARIYNRHTWHRLVYDEIRQVGFRPFGGVDLRYPGDLLQDHTLGSIVLIKEPL